jgi:hypothetical protein
MNRIAARRVPAAFAVLSRFVTVTRFAWELVFRAAISARHWDKFDVAGAIRLSLGAVISQSSFGELWLGE